MESHKKIGTEIVVYDYKRNIISNAKVTLKPLEKTNEIVHLQYDESEKFYKSNEINFERYILKVETDNFRTEEREVKVDPLEGLKDIIILGKEGQPFYYRGNVKVPFEPRTDLIAVAMSSKHVTKSAKQTSIDDDLEGYINNLNLEDIPVNNSISKSGVRVFKIKSNTTAKNRESVNKIEEELTKNPSIKVAGPILQMNDDSLSFLTNEIVVKLKPDVNKEEISSIINQYDLEVIRSISYLNNTFILRSKFPANYGLLNICEQIVQSGKVEYAEPNIYSTVVKDSITPSDFLFSKQWHISTSSVSSAWSILNGINQDITFGSPNIIIAVMDSGIDANHAEFNGRVSNGSPKIYKLFDFANMVPNNDNLDDGDHGTCCAGVAAGNTNNKSEISGENEGIAGASGNCRVIGIRHPGWEEGQESEFADAYMWAAGLDSNNSRPGFPSMINPGADIITNSFGYSVGVPISSLMKETFDTITTHGRGGKGTLLFFSAGNANSPFDLQRPWAAYSKTFAIAASSLTADGTNEIRATYSNYGETAIIDLCAPSNDGAPRNYFITTATIRGSGDLPGHTGGNSDYTSTFGGTSSATPLAAGIAALVLTSSPELTWIKVRDILRSTALKIDANNTNQIGRWKDINGNISSDPNYIGPHYSKWYGYGRVDAAAAVRMALNQNIQ
jgi:subtilisin family serine protease